VDQLLINRTKGLVLGFFAAAWLSFVVILVVTPKIYDDAIQLRVGNNRPAEVGFLVALTAFLLLLSAGVVQNWRWTFWLVLIAFPAGILRVPVGVLQLAGVLNGSGPAWYAAYQAVIGVAQFAIGVFMIAGYRRHGLWGEP
jgi:hypothetical protein